MCLWSVAINRCDWHLKHWMNKRHTERVSVKWGRVEVVRFWPRMCAPNQFSVSSVFPVGSIWQPCSASWASARRWFAPKWQRERARSSWPTPFISSLLRRALASRWCRSHSSCAISGRLDSLSPQRLHPDDPPTSTPTLFTILLLSNNQPLMLFIGHNLEKTDHHCKFRWMS